MPVRWKVPSPWVTAIVPVPTTETNAPARGLPLSASRTTPSISPSCSGTCADAGADNTESPATAATMPVRKNASRVFVTGCRFT